MSKPIDTVAAKMAEQTVEDEFGEAAKTSLGLITGGFGHIRYNLLAFSSLCQRHGKNALIQRIADDYGSNVATACLSTLEATATMWTTLTNETLPDFPAVPE